MILKMIDEKSAAGDEKKLSQRSGGRCRREISSAVRASKDDPELSKKISPAKQFMKRRKAAR